MTEKKLIVANWKMNPPSEAKAKQLFEAYKKAASKQPSVQVVVAPPFPYIGTLSKKAGGKRCVLAAQDVFWEKSGAYTGEVSALQLAQYKLEYVIVGHSERRAFGETSAQVAKKAVAALSEGLLPIVCVGEKARGTGTEYFSEVWEQLRASLEGIPKAALAKIAIAYEPVWAISTSASGREATPDDAREMGGYIKRMLAQYFDMTEHDPTATLLYGGSVDDTNVADFLGAEGIDGVLVGSASLKKDVFVRMIENCS